MRMVFIASGQANRAVWMHMFCSNCVLCAIMFLSLSLLVRFVSASEYLSCEKIYYAYWMRHVVSLLLYHC